MDFGEIFYLSLSAALTNSVLTYSSLRLHFPGELRISDSETVIRPVQQFLFYAPHLSFKEKGLMLTAYVALMCFPQDTLYFSKMDCIDRV